MVLDSYLVFLLRTADRVVYALANFPIFREVSFYILDCFSP